MKYILCDTKEIADAEVGGKAAGLAALSALGCAVPSFCVVPQSAMRVLFANSSSPVLSAVADGKCVNLNREQLASALVPANLCEEFTTQLHAAAKSLGATTFAVRSSCEAEDGTHRSYAGQFRTLTDVDEAGLLDALCEVWMSALTYRVSRYAGDAFDGGISVIIQRMIGAQKSGVCLTHSPNNEKNILIEYVDGKGEILVGGVTTPVTLDFARGKKLADPTLEELRSTALRLENKRGFPLDIEWCVEDGKLWFVQMRPITVASASPVRLPKGEWSLYVKRDFPWYNHSIQRAASLKAPQTELFGFWLPIFEGALLDGEEYYTARNDEACARIWESFDDGEWFDFEVAVRTLCVRNETVIAKLRSQTQFDASDFTRFEKAYLNSYVPLMMRPDEFIADKLTRLGVNEFDLRALSYVDESTEYAEEGRAFTVLAQQIAWRKPTADKKAKEYATRFGWMKNPMGATTEAYTREDIDARAATFSRAEWRRKRRSAVAARLKNKREYARASAALTPGARIWAERLRAFVFLRTRAAETSDKLFFYLRAAFLPQAAKRWGIGEDKLLMCGMGGELCDAIQKGILPEDVDRRVAGDLTIWTEGVPQTFFGAPPKNIEIALRGNVSDGKISDVIEGAVACAGRVSGVVRIIENASEVKKLSKGEILVSSMTTPDLIEAIERAAGFITDEGGVSCHASILARELNVPCVVGTKCATKLLRDGMRVDLDAYAGVIRILSEK